jgi:hypothetical protein
MGARQRCARPDGGSDRRAEWTARRQHRRIPAGVKQLAIVDTSLTLQGVAHDWEY